MFIGWIGGVHGVSMAGLKSVVGIRIVHLLDERGGRQEVAQSRSSSGGVQMRKEIPVGTVQTIGAIRNKQNK